MLPLKLEMPNEIYDPRLCLRMLFYQVFYSLNCNFVMETVAEIEKVPILAKTLLD